MEMIILIGIPASGKTSLYKQLFFDRYMRISLDLYRTRNKEQQFLQLALACQQKVVIDNTNTTKEERAKYISLARLSKYEVKGYYLQSHLVECLSRNDNRPEISKIDKVGVIAKHNELVLPRLEEGFNKLFYIEVINNGFNIKDWQNEV